MKKFIINLMLIIFIIPITCCVLVGCKNKQDISKFYETYLSIAENYTGLKKTAIKDTYHLEDETYKIDFDYEVMSALQSRINLASSKYYYLEGLYHNLLDASLEPLYVYTPKVVKLKLSDAEVNKLYSELDEFKEDLYHLLYTKQVLNTSLQASAHEDINLTQLNRVFKQYEVVISSASDLSCAISNIYFEKIMLKSNTNYSKLNYTQLTDSDLTSLQVNMKANFHYYKAMFASAYNQLLISYNSADEIIDNNSPTLPDYAPYTNLYNAKLTDKHISMLQNNKLAIYNRLNSLYNMQTSINTHYQKFNKSINAKNNLGVDTNTVTKHQIYQYSINQFIYGNAYDSYEVIYSLLTNLFAF